MTEQPGDWPSPPGVDVTPPIMPAQTLQKWLALALSLFGSSCFFALMMASPKIWSISESLWMGVYYGFQWCSFVGFILGAFAYRHWQGMIAMLLGAICTVVLIYNLITHPFIH